MNRGTQIIYVPMHTDGDLNHPDCEEGFITSIKPGVAYCRYWSKHSPGELRTKANSEGTPMDMIVVQDTHPQHIVDTLLRGIP